MARNSSTLLNPEKVAVLTREVGVILAQLKSVRIGNGLLSPTGRQLFEGPERPPKEELLQLRSELEPVTLLVFTLAGEGFSELSRILAAYRRLEEDLYRG